MADQQLRSTSTKNDIAHDMHPSNTVQKFLISSPCPFEGFLSTKVVAISGANIGFQHYLLTRTANDRHAFILSFRTNPSDHAGLGGLIIPNYHSSADAVCDMMSLLYGKRFDNHGAYEHSGYFEIPDLSSFSENINRKPPQNSSEPRADYPVSLNIAECRRFLGLLTNPTIRSDDVERFTIAARFYRLALAASDKYIEIAFMYLVMAGEIISTSIQLDEDSLLDSETKTMLSKIESKMPDGKMISKKIRKRITSIKSRFIAALSSLVDDGFFNRSESKTRIDAFRADRFQKTLGEAYDIRSRYVHTGNHFGMLVMPNGMDHDEVVGTKFVHGVRYQRPKPPAPTFVGMERIIRYCLLRFAEKSALIDLRLDIPEDAIAEQALPATKPLTPTSTTHSPSKLRMNSARKTTTGKRKA